jgi:hypothetical protein
LNKTLARPIPSRIRCESGLFIGVDRFASMPREQRLCAPAEDASQLAGYFRQAHPGDTWRVLKSTQRSAPNLVTALKGLQQLAADVSPGKAGVFYYAGHAEVGDHGLVLKTGDSHPLFPNDTGLRLSRVLRLFKDEIARNKYFLLILDCCRSGVREAAVDDIPPNCCVLYACQHGDVAVENAVGGVLTRSLMDTINNYTLRKSSRDCPLEFVVSNLHRQIFSWRPLDALSYEICGNLVDRLVLPLPEERVPASWDVDLNVVVKYRFASRNAFEWALYSVVYLLAEWHSLPLSSRAAKEYIHEQLRYPSDDQSDEGLFLDVKVPIFSGHRKPSSFLGNILENVNAEEPESVAIRWPKSLSPAPFQMLKHTLPNGEWSQSDTGGGFSLRWRSNHAVGEFRGIAWVDTAGQSTQVRLACETLDAHPIGLKYLLPGLTDLVDLMLAIRSSK